MRSRLQLPIAPEKKLAALVCLLAVILLFGAAPLYALLHAVPNLTGLAAAARVIGAFASLLVLWLVITRI